MIPLKKSVLAFDTETTGKADFRAAPNAKHQPHVVQIGAQLFDVDRKVRGEINLIIKPEGWIIPQESTDIHGISQKTAEKYGVPLVFACQAFQYLALQAEVFVAHNLQFDDLMMRRTYSLAPEVGVPVNFTTENGFCTMKATTPICKIKGPYGDKWPKLIEAHQFLFNEGFEGAHDAMADVRACARVYMWLMDQRENRGSVNDPNKSGGAVQTEAKL